MDIAVNPSASSRSRTVLLFAVMLAAMLWLFRDTAAAMVSIWFRSETYTHAVLVPPIALWLAWRRRDRWVGLPQQPMPWMLVPMAAACALWLLAELAVVDAAAHFAFVALIVLSVPALFGWAVTRELLFPLGFLFFAVPFGEFLVPALIDHTADFTIAALRATGIPVYREGNDFVIPSGHWSVVEACSGVRYLIASLMVGTLFAYLNYTSMRRRWLFIGVSILVPIVANWLRAYMIVMIGHLSNNTLAVGVDHLIYGWVFFGVVIGLMFLIGSRWAEPEAAAASNAGAVGASVTPAGPGHWGVALGVIALLLATQGARWQLDRTDLDTAPVALSLPQSQGPATSLPFTPGFRKVTAQATTAYRIGGQTVWVWVGYYRGQSADRKLVTSTNLVSSPEDTRWAQVGGSLRSISGASPAVTVQSTELREATTPLAGGQAQRLRVWQTYWIDGRWTTSAPTVKLLQAVNRLRGAGDDGAVVMMATPLDAQADDRLESALREHLDDIGARLTAASQSR